MGEFVTVTASDGHELSAYVAKPEGAPKGAVVVVQEIFGINPSIRDVADHYAEQGYVGIAPALFDRIERDLELGYGPDDMKKAFELYPLLKPELSLLDIAAAFKHVATAGKTAVLGFCYGGLISWLSTTRAKALGIAPACTVGYYAGGIGNVAKEEPVCPVLLHFGTDDDHIRKDQVDAVRSAHPEVTIHLYEGAGHAFANPARPSYVGAQARIADDRSLAFLKQHLA